MRSLRLFPTPPEQKARPRDFAISFLILGAGVTPAARRAGDYVFHIFLFPFPLYRKGLGVRCAPPSPAVSISKSPKRSHTPATRDSAAKSRTPASISGAIASITPFGNSRANACHLLDLAKRPLAILLKVMDQTSRTHSPQHHPSPLTPAIQKSLPDGSADARPSPRPTTTSVRRGTD